MKTLGTRLISGSISGNCARVVRLTTVNSGTHLAERSYKRNAQQRMNSHLFWVLNVLIVNEHSQFFSSSNHDSNERESFSGKYKAKQRKAIQNTVDAFLQQTSHVAVSFCFRRFSSFSALLSSFNMTVNLSAEIICSENK